MTLDDFLALFRRLGLAGFVCGMGRHFSFSLFVWYRLRRCPPRLGSAEFERGPGKQQMDIHFLLVCFRLRRGRPRLGLAGFERGLGKNKNGYPFFACLLSPAKRSA